MENKRRVLILSEASSLATGFSTISRELIPRLVDSGKFEEVAEIGCYVTQSDQRQHDFVKGRWKWWGAMPETEEDKVLFNQPDPAQPGQNVNQFGKWIFDKVLIEFKPDIVLSFRDVWMDSFVGRSPLRNTFRWVYMSTVDSAPQREEWLETFNNANYLLGYSDYGIHTLRKTSPFYELRFDPPGKKGLVKLPGKLHPIPMRPGVDLKTFRSRTEEEKGLLKNKWGLKSDVPIFLIVQRNQARKRIAEALVSFAKMKLANPNNELIKKSILLIHSAWPDNITSTDFPREIERIHRGYHGIPVHYPRMAFEVCSTFICLNDACQDKFIAPSINLRKNPQGVIHCPKCGQQSARTPNTGLGYTREDLSEIMGMSDLLVQVSIAEGCGMTVQESKACGLPVLATDYASLSEKGKIPNYDHIDKNNYTAHLGGESIKVYQLRYEAETGCHRAETCIEDTAHKMATLMSDVDKRKQMALDARKCAELNYDWDKIYKQWEFVLNSVKINNRKDTWDKPARFINISSETPDASMPDDQFVIWCYTQLLGYGSADDIDIPGFNNWTQQLAAARQQGAPMDQVRAQIISYFKEQAMMHNRNEQLRTGGHNALPKTSSFEAVIL